MKRIKNTHEKIWEVYNKLQNLDLNQWYWIKYSRYTGPAKLIYSKSEWRQHLKIAQDAIKTSNDLLKYQKVASVDMKTTGDRTGCFFVTDIKGLAKEPPTYDALLKKCKMKIEDFKL